MLIPPDLVVLVETRDLFAHNHIVTHARVVRAAVQGGFATTVIPETHMDYQPYFTPHAGGRVLLGVLRGVPLRLGVDAGLLPLRETG